MKTHRLFIHVLCCAMVLIGFGMADAAEPTRIHYFGNSLTDQLRYDSFKKLCDGSSHPIDWKREMAPGVPVFWHWEQKPRWEKKLTEQKWDVVTLQPFQNFELEYQGCVNFAKFLAEKQPDVQLYIYAQWQQRHTGDWLGDFMRTGKVETEQAWDGSCRKKTGEPFWLEKVAADAVKKGYPVKVERSFKNQYELTVQGLNATGILKKPVRLIPVGHVFELLSSKMRAGLVPGYQSPYQFYGDGIHLWSVGSYIVACTFYATIFQTSPVGLPVGEYQYQKGSANIFISPELVKVLHETIWEVVASHPLTGVNSNEPVKVATAALKPAVQGEPYDFQLLAAFGKVPHRWIAGTLPTGLTLRGDGLLTGTPTVAPSETPISVVVTDANGKSATRELLLTVEADTAPKITTPLRLPDRRLGEYFTFKFEAKGGNGLFWEPADKKAGVPAGLLLNPDGTLIGSPGKEGTNVFKMKVTDNDRANPESDTAEFTLKVGPPAVGVFRVRTLSKETKFEWDGVLDEPFWNLKEPIQKVVMGEKTNVQAWFDVVRIGSDLVVAVRVIDPHPYVSKTKPLWDGDSVELFIDVQNNREEVYNYDDRRIVVADKRNVFRVAPLAFGLDARLTKTDNGYTVEFVILKYSLAFNSLMTSVMGLDIAVNDDRDGTGRSSQVVWQGTKENDTVPKFGTIVLEPESEKPGATK